MKELDNVRLAGDDVARERGMVARGVATHAKPSLQPALAQWVGGSVADYHATPAYYPTELGVASEPAAISGAADVRGPRWYDYHTYSHSNDNIGIVSGAGGGSLLSLDSETMVSSSEASSKDTRERKRRTRAYRECTACPLDMVRKHSNYGIKWICGAYQRARRTFKSECMMRYRNCQDGTMFVRVAAQRCTDDPFHGKHWFYVYRI